MRCTHIFGLHHHLQCTLEATPGSSLCKMHGGWHEDAKQLRNYKIEKYKERLNGLVSNEGLKTLTDELAILRLLLENRINRTEDENDLMLQSDGIADLAIKIKSLVESITKLEVQQGQVIGVAQIKIIAAKMLDIMSEFLTEEQLEICSFKILDLFETAKFLEPEGLNE